MIVVFGIVVFVRWQDDELPMPFKPKGGLTKELKCRTYHDVFLSAECRWREGIWTRFWGPLSRGRMVSFRRGL